MATEESTMALGRRVYGLGIIAIGAVGLARGDFVSGQPVPDHFPARTLLAYVAALFMLIAGAAVAWRRIAVWAAAALAAYFTFVVVVMNGPGVIAGYDQFISYSSVSEQLAIAAGGLIVFAATAEIDPALAARLMRAAQILFGICAILFGGAHFFYMNLTAPLVPKWLPPGQVFWADATGAAQIAAGIAFVTGVQARLAAILLTIMYVSFGVLVHAPMLAANPASNWIWIENATNLALVGVAWVVADSLTAPKLAGPRDP